MDILSPGKNTHYIGTCPRCNIKVRLYPTEVTITKNEKQNWKIIKSKKWCVCGMPSIYCKEPEDI